MLVGKLKRWGLSVLRITLVNEMELVRTQTKDHLRFPKKCSQMKIGQLSTAWSNCSFCTTVITFSIADFAQARDNGPQSASFV